MGGGKKGGQQQTGQQTTQTKLPPWLEQAYKGTLGFGAQVADLPYRPYRGDVTAGLDPLTKQAISFTGRQMGVAGDTMRGLIPGLRQLGGYTPEQVQAGQFAGTDLSPYMNPYIENVVNTSLGALDRQRQMAQQQNAARAQQAGAFGGSRHGITEGQTNEAAMREAGQLGANLYSQGFGQAAGLAESDINRRLQQDIFNQQMGLQGAQFRQGALESTGRMAQAAQQANLQAADAASRAGALKAAERQKNLDWRYNQFLEQRGWPEHQLNIMLQALSGAPGVGTTTSTSSIPGGNPFLGALGMGLSGAQLGNMMFPGMGGLFGGLAGFGLGLI